MKRISTIIIAIAMCLVLVVAAGCNADVTVGSEGTASLIITTDTDELTTYTVMLEDLEDNTVVSLLDYLVDTEELHLVYTDSTWGAYITEIGTLAEDYTTGTYIYLYTSVDSEMDTSAYATSLEVAGVTVYSSGLGVTSMSLTDGCVIYITAVTF